MYENCIAKFRQRVEEEYPGLQQNDFGDSPPNDRSKGPDLASYLLWMCGQIEQFVDPRKATLWIAYIMAYAEYPLELFGNNTTRNCVRADLTGYEMAAIEYYTKNCPRCG